MFGPTTHRTNTHTDRHTHTLSISRSSDMNISGLTLSCQAFLLQWTWYELNVTNSEYKRSVCVTPCLLWLSVSSCFQFLRGARRKWKWYTVYLLCSQYLLHAGWLVRHGHPKGHWVHQRKFGELMLKTKNEALNCLENMKSCRTRNEWIQWNLYSIPG